MEWETSTQLSDLSADSNVIQDLRQYLVSFSLCNNNSLYSCMADSVPTKVSGSLFTHFNGSLAEPVSPWCSKLLTCLEAKFHHRSWRTILEALLPIPILPSFFPETGGWIIEVSRGQNKHIIYVSPYVYRFIDPLCMPCLHFAYFGDFLALPRDFSC